MCLCERVPRTVEEEFAVVCKARPCSIKNKHKWEVEIYWEWSMNIEISGFRSLKCFSNISACVLSRAIWRRRMLYRSGLLNNMRPEN